VAIRVIPNVSDRHYRFRLKIDEIDIKLVRMYFELFSKEDLLDESGNVLHYINKGVDKQWKR